MKIAEQKRKWYDEQMKHLIIDRQMTKSDIARALNILPQALNSIDSGARGLSDKFLDDFAETFGLKQIVLFPEDLNGIKTIPLIPHEAFAGYGAYQYPDLPIEEFYQIREFHNANFLLRVSGDSMSPKYHSGDLVACLKIDELTFWQWHRVYAINTRNQGILIKRIEKSDVPDAVTCVSENPAYDPFDINKQEIVSVALVLGGVVME